MSSCLCNNSTCCGALSGNVYVNCGQILSAQGQGGLFWIENVPVKVNPCSDVICKTGQCTIISLLSQNGKTVRRRSECCQTGEFGQVNCGHGVNCQQTNKNGTYTVCCSPSCATFNQTTLTRFVKQIKHKILRKRLKMPIVLIVCDKETRVISN